jgi:hypothetical protein
MRTVIERVASALSSLWLSCVLLTLLGLLTWLGTLEQTQSGLFEVQRKYFDSIFLVHQAGPVPIPLPGATLVMGVLFVNLILGGMLRMRRGWATAGILIVHLGIAFLLVAGFVKAYWSEDGHLTLFEGQRSNEFESYHRWELAALERLDGGRVRETVAPQERFQGATDGSVRRLRSDALPFEIEVHHFLPNARVLPKGPMVAAKTPVVDGFFLSELPLERDNELNAAGAYVTVVEAGGARREGLLWGLSRQPLTIEVEGRTFGLELRRERYPMPFTLELDDFVKEDHPGMAMAKSFSSDVTVLEDGSPRPVRIEMNEPLRAEGLVLYQSSWGPPDARPGEPLFSTFSVVRNPADQYPLYACVVIAIGLATHFSRKLARHVRSEARTS